MIVTAIAWMLGTRSLPRRSRTNAHGEMHNMHEARVSPLRVRRTERLGDGGPSLRRGAPKRTADER